MSAPDRARGVTLAQLLAVDDFKDAEGRPLGEQRASAAALAGVPVERRECPYADSRKNHSKPMNVSALKQLSAAWAPALAGMETLRALWKASTSRPGTASADWLRMGVAVAALPHYLFFRDAALADGQLPQLVAAMYKIVIGVNRTLQVIHTSELMAPGSGQPTADEIYQFADGFEFLVGRREVCAGSPRQITDAVAALIRGTKEDEAVRRALLALIGDPARFAEFAELFFRVDCAKFLYRFVMTDVLCNLKRDLAAQALSPVPAPQIDETIDRVDSVDTFRRLCSYGDRKKEIILAGWFELLEPGRAPVAQIGIARGSPLAAARTRYQAFEREMLSVLARLERELNVALGRAAASHSLSGSDVSAAFGPTLTDFFDELPQADA